MVIFRSREPTTAIRSASAKPTAAMLATAEPGEKISANHPAVNPPIAPPPHVICCTPNNRALEP